jgi:serine/threonine protein kinase
MTTLEPGVLLDRRYRIVQPLGKGGFGRTYIAEDTRRPGNPHCVVKHLKPASSNPTFLKNARRLFLTEAETLEMLGKHAQIPRLLAYFEEDQEFYLVQDLIEGYSLNHEFKPGQRWSELRVCEMLQDVLNILIFIHGQGVIHRDIKPENIIRRRQDGKLVLVDFGAVKQIQNQSLQGNVSSTIAVGTPGYISSEQSFGKPRPNSDIYALGIVGIQAITGLPPSKFREDPETGELIWRSLTTVSDGLAAILSQMVRYHFKERYQAATEVLRDLIPFMYQCSREVDAPVDEASTSISEPSEILANTETLSLPLAARSLSEIAVELPEPSGGEVVLAEPPVESVIEEPTAELEVETEVSAAAVSSGLELVDAPVESVPSTADSVPLATLAVERSLHSPLSESALTTTPSQPTVFVHSSSNDQSATANRWEQFVRKTPLNRFVRDRNSSSAHVPSTVVDHSQPQPLRLTSQKTLIGAGVVAVGLIVGVSQFANRPPTLEKSVTSSNFAETSTPSPAAASPTSTPQPSTLALPCESFPLVELTGRKPDLVKSGGAGFSYYGPVTKGKPADGRGIQLFANGDRYDGEFRKGQFNGCGIVTFAKSYIRSYVGQFQDGKFDGLGLLLWVNGDRYIGEFKKGRCQGKGTFIAANRPTPQAGIWENGDLVNGKLSCSRIN